MRTTLIILVSLVFTLSSFAQKKKKWLKEDLITHSNDSVFFLGQHLETVHSLNEEDFLTADSILVINGFWGYIGPNFYNYLFNFRNERLQYSLLKKGRKKVKRLKSINSNQIRKELLLLYQSYAHNKLNNIDISSIGVGRISGSHRVYLYINNKLFIGSEKYFEMNKLHELLKEIGARDY